MAARRRIKPIANPAGPRWEITLTARQGLRGATWGRTWFEQYNLSLIDWIKLEVGRSRKKGAVYGHCYLPTEANPIFRLSCQLPGPFPTRIPIRKSPLYADERGRFPPIPAGCQRGVQVIDERTGRQWLRLIGWTTLANADEAAVWILAHEAFHYLRATRQVPGRNNEIEADRFADELLAQYQRRGA